MPMRKASRAPFDGRYLYLVPNSNGAPDGVVARYDTTGTFSDRHSWTTFDLGATNANAGGFIGAVFDGQYVYFVPWQNDTGSDGLVVRYDTRASFTDLSSYLSFDVATNKSAAAVGFSGAAFDGHYIYFVPSYDAQSLTHDGVLARYDTRATFTDADSWMTFDIGTVNPTSAGFAGATFDGQYLYLVPNHNNTDYDGVVTRYDTQSSSLGSSWTTFDTATLDGGPAGFAGATFDGQYIYLVPYADQNVVDGLVTRYDTRAEFTSGESWSVFDTAQLNTQAVGFIGATFDGRYVYLAPAFGGIVVRCDTRAAFADPSSWTALDTTSVNASAAVYFGAAFDGRYVYLVPDSNGTVARFDAKTPPALPSIPEFGASFY